MTRMSGMGGVMLAAALLVSGCAGGGDSSDGGETTTAPTPDELASAVHSLATSGAEGYMVTGEDSTATAGAAVLAGATTAVDLEPNSLYKVTTDGTLQRVPVEDANGDEVPRGSVRPADVQDVNDTFMFVWFYVPGLNGEDADDDYIAAAEMIPYLVRKSDGLAFDASGVLEAYPPASLPGEVSNATILTDENDNIFVSRSVSLSDDTSGTSQFWTDATFARIDTSNIGNGALTARVLQDVDIIRSHALPKSGDYLIYSGERKTDETQKVVRMLDVASDTLIDLSIAAHLNGTSFTMFSAHDGRTYAAGNDSVYRVSVASDGSPDTVNLGALTKESVDKVKDPSNLNPVRNWPMRLVVDGRDFVAGEMGRTWEIDLEHSPQPLARLHDKVFELLSTVRDVRVSGKAFWYLGDSIAANQDAIVRYDPLSETAQTFEALLDPDTGSTLDMNDFRVLASDRVWFEALRLSDQATVIGEIDASGNVTITDVVAADEPASFVLEPIFPSDFVVIDGDFGDWSTDLRVATDVADDATATGDEITYYSQMSANGDYLGLVEFKDTIDATHRTRIRLNDAYELRIDDGAATVVPVDSASDYHVAPTATEDALPAIGGEAAVGDAVEFRLPATAVGSPPSYQASIARVGDADVEGLTWDKPSTDFIIEVYMATPLGDGKVTLGLGNNYTLEFSATTATLDDGATTHDLGSISGASIDRNVDPITVTIPQAELGSPSSLTLTEVSTEEVLDTLSTN